MSRRRFRRSGAGPTGLLLVDKPSGITSHDVVIRVRRMARQPRVGHAGTLDPLATGLLPMLLGEATKLSPFATAHDKTYEVTCRLGQRTDTLDADGEILQESPLAPDLGQDTVERAMASLRGEISQVVPRFSAVRVSGRRLHELARQGQDVTPPRRRVTIHRLELLELDLPRLRLVVDCSKGTYVRQLVADLGDMLGPGAHVTQLRRTRVGDLSVAHALPLHELTAESVGERLVSPRSWAASTMSCLECTPDQAMRTRQGQRLTWEELHVRPRRPGPFALVAGDELLAVAEPTPQAESDYRLLRVFGARDKRGDSSPEKTP